MRARSEPDLWLYKSLESSILMSDATEHHHHGEGDERRDQPKTMRWPCNHHWGKWACNRWVNTMGAKCQECKVREDVPLVFSARSRPGECICGGWSGF